MAKNDDNRFVVSYRQNPSFSNFDIPYARVVVDRETRVQYLYIGAGNAGGPTVLVDENGKPLLYKGN